MLHNVLIVCAFISVPFICIYMFYTCLVIGLPDHKKRGGMTLKRRLHAVIRGQDFYFVFLLPCLNEEKVIRNTLESILSLPYKNILAVVIDDASDDNTAEIVRGMKDGRVRLHLRRFPNARKGKGEALNSCYRRVNRAVSLLGINPSSVIIGVIDGDGRPSTNLLAEAVECFVHGHVGAAQSRIRITNRDKLLPLMQDLEFSTAVGAIQNAREYLKSVGLGGNGQFTRLSALQSLGESPWTACLLEDFDLGLRILLHGWDIRFLSESYVAQQGLVSIRRFIRQRARWVQGNMQCLRYLRSIVQANLPRSAKLDLLYFLAQPWMNMLGTVIQLSAYVALLCTITSESATSMHGSPIDWGTSFAFWALLTWSPGFVWAFLYRSHLVHHKKRRVFLAGLFYPLYNTLLLPSVWLAFLRHTTNKNQWAKTERLTDSVP